MTLQQIKIYNYVKENPNSRVDDVIKYTKFSRSFVYKFLSTKHFCKLQTKENNIHFMAYIINDTKVIANHQTPKHHEIHQAFWGSYA